jgi:hypothetical protein
VSFRHVFAVDPGDVRNGFCYFKYDVEKKVADVKIMDIFTGKQLEDTLKLVWGIGQPKEDGAKPELHFVVENFRVDSKVRGKAFQWNEVLTARNIGKVELCANWLDAPLTIQEPTILAMGRKWAPWSNLPAHIPDDKSAYIHGAKFMMDRGWINTVDQITMFGQETL